MTAAHDLKKIPYGVSDFNDFKVKNLYYVDKTRFIRDIEEKGNFLFLIRPRRFGKSLFLAILQAYYDIEYKDRFDFFFEERKFRLAPYLPYLWCFIYVSFRIVVDRCTK